ncbi:hypothetical protein ACE1CI_35375 [Aerosakkonemataceae cyanobacterium BLCC-F50]|uniref:Uncharacterized protein n=1 Tax=Floridaenema flaviceps BLCC-F50 TaxID=3153642 RepID=A0ABV4Y2J8_9CYAN
MKSEALFHSAQQLDNLSPNIISSGKHKLDPVEKKAERQHLVLQMDDVTSTGKKISISPNVIVYYKQADFVIKTIPDERDSYNRLAPILSYGEFPNGELNSDTENGWIQSIKDQIIEFVNSIGRNLSSDTKAEITQVLKELLQKKRREQLINMLAGNLLVYGTVVVVPLTLGWLIQNQIPTEEIWTAAQQTLLKNLVWFLATLVAISNTVMLFIIRLLIDSLMNGHKRKKR